MHTDAVIHGIWNNNKLVYGHYRIVLTEFWWGNWSAMKILLRTKQQEEPKERLHM